MTRAAAAAPLEEIVEKELTKQIIQVAELLGYKRAYHTYDSRRSQTGFPDLVLVRDRVVFIEVKREPKVATPLTAAQKEWLTALRDAGAEVYVIRPRHLQLITRVLGARRNGASHLTTASATEARTELLQELEREVAA